MRQITINFSNKILYTFLAIVGMALLSVSLYAYGTSAPATFGHSANEIEGVCKTDGTGCPSFDTIPSGAIMMFDSACSTGWTYLSSMENKFPRGGSSYGITGGSDNAVVVSHIHSVDPPNTLTTSNGAHTHSVAMGGGGTSDAEARGDGTGSFNTGSAGTHAHGVNIPAFNSASTGVSGVGANVPSYVTVVFCLKN